MAYRLIIADDEAAVRQGLVSIVDWAALGFIVTGVFTDGQEAIAYMSENPVDAALCDIVMKKTSGLDVADWMLKNRPDTPLVLLSAYEDFKLAQRAVSLRVHRYLTKPTQIDEMTSVFRGIAALLDERKQRMHSDSERSGQIVRAIVSLLEQGKLSGGEFDGLLGHLADGRTAAACILYPQGADGAPPLPSPARFEGCALRAGYLWFANTKDSAALRLYAQNAARQAGLPASAVRSGELTEILAMLFGENETGQTWSRDERDAIRRLNALIDAGDYAALPAFFANHSTDDTPVCRLCAGILRLRAGALCGPQGLPESEEDRQKLLGILEGEAGGAALTEWVASVCALLNKMTMEKDEQLLKSIDEYIISHMKQGVTLADAARHVYLSPSYLSRLFKAKAGIGFAEYQMRARIRQAQKMLIESRLGVSEVARAVGYLDSRYFVKLFRQLSGMSPTEFRRRQ